MSAVVARISGADANARAIGSKKLMIGRIGDSSTTTKPSSAASGSSMSSRRRAATSNRTARGLARLISSLRARERRAPAGTVRCAAPCRRA